MADAHGSGYDRRSFLRLAGGAIALGALASGAGGLVGSWPATAATTNDDFVEDSLDELQQAMAKGRVSSRELTRWYLERIDRLNPLLGAVIETNPDALAIAADRDRERRAGRLRGPLHGLPILVKDNLATADRMQTTAGSLALVGSRVAADAVVVAQLRAAGAVILGKANLSEWANFRGFGSINGWSARGGFTRNPYLLSFDPGGSSSGSAVSAAASLCAAAVGTETDGSITYPSGLNSLVGLKPTVGLVAQQGIIPIAFSQDTAGPMARTATDAAILLGVLQSPFPAVGLTPPANLPTDYRSFLQPGALRGARIGVDPLLFDFAAQGFPPELAGQFDLTEALAALASAGAVVIDDVASTDVFSVFDPELQVLLSEFKVGIRRYLSTISRSKMQNLADLIQFNKQHCEEELVYFGQELFEMAQATSGLDDPAYTAARATCLTLTRQQGIDRAFRQHRLDALIGPTFGVASTAPAVAGYPHISVPGGFDANGVPVGASLFAQPWDEGKLLGFAFALEREAGFRRPPRLRGQVPPPPPPFDGCTPGSGAAAGADAAAAAAAAAVAVRSGSARPGR
ncbi:MAG TPA: amidase [Streptosporangiaceae bacterium]